MQAANRTAMKLTTDSLRLLSVAVSLAATLSAQQMWVERKPPTRPPNRTDVAMTYDAARGRVVLFAGGGTAGPTTWEWDGSQWARVVTAVTPSARTQVNMTYDAARKRVVLFGGFSRGVLGDLWEFDGKTWSRIQTATSPPARCCPGLTFDTRRQRVVLFGGFDGRVLLGDTWEYDGRNWVRRTPAKSPPPRCCNAMVYDAAHGVVLLFGGALSAGNGDFADTWEYSGGSWVERKPAASPSPRRGFAMVYDSARSRVVLFGGGQNQLTTPKFGDTWEWDSKTWVQIPGTGPSPRSAHTMAYDAGRARTVAFAGWSIPSSLHPDTWEYVSRDLQIDTHLVSVARGGVQNLVLDAGTTHAGKIHILLGSLSGTQPGIRIGNVTLPLNIDAYFGLLLGSPNSIIVPSVGLLDASGKRKARLTLPGGLPSALLGQRAYHAYVVAGAPFRFDFASNPAPLNFVK